MLFGTFAYESQPEIPKVLDSDDPIFGVELD